MNTIANNVKARGAVRGPRESLIQTLWFEALGLAIVSLPFAHFSGLTVGDSLAMLFTLSIVVMVWAAVHNSAFDRIEQRLTGRLASDRPQRWRVVHVLSLEVSAIVVTWPLVVALTPLSWLEAFFAEIGLTLAYVAYGYLFHLSFDRLRPVKCEPGSAA